MEGDNLWLSGPVRKGINKKKLFLWIFPFFDYFIETLVTNGDN